MLLEFRELQGAYGLYFSYHFSGIRRLSIEGFEIQLKIHQRIVNIKKGWKNNMKSMDFERIGKEYSSNFKEKLFSYEEEMIFELI